MKRFFFIFLTFNLLSVSLKAQSNTKFTSEIKEKDCGCCNFEIPEDKLNEIFSQSCLEKQVSYCDGFEVLHGFLSANLRKNENFEDKKGRVFIEFVVEKDGSLSNFKVLRDIGFNFGQEAIRVLKLTKGWIPASHKGKKLRTRFTIPILISN